MGNGEVPEGFPHSPWTLRFPNNDTVYISKCNSNKPAEGQWHALNLEDRTIASENDISVHIIGDSAAQVHTCPERAKRLKFLRFQRLQRQKEKINLKTRLEDLYNIREKRTKRSFIKFARRKCARTNSTLVYEENENGDFRVAAVTNAFLSMLDEDSEL